MRLLNFRYDDRFGFAYRGTGQATQAIQRPHRDRLVRHLKNIRRTHFDALFAGIAFLGIDIDQIDFVVSGCLWHDRLPLSEFSDCPLKSRQRVFDGLIADTESDPKMTGAIEPAARDDQNSFFFQRIYKFDIIRNR
jgi:hypothetical protein